MFLDEISLASLETAVTLHMDALRIRTTHKLDRTASFGGLASALYSRFYRTGQIEDLDKAISLYRESVGNALQPDRLGWLHGLCAALLTRFGKIGQFEDLRDAVAWYIGSSIPVKEIACDEWQADHSVSENKGYDDIYSKHLKSPPRSLS
jgi:hypothetical protein